MGDRHQHIAFRIVGRNRPARQSVCYELQSAEFAMHTIIVIGDEPHRVTVSKARFGYIIGVHQDHVARPLDPTEPVAVAIDGGVELIVRPHGDEAIAARPVLEAKRIELRRSGHDRLAAVGFPNTLACWIAAVEAARLEHARIEIGKIVGVCLFDEIAHQRIIAGPLVPFEFRVGFESRLGDPCNNRQFAFEMF